MMIIHHRHVVVPALTLLLASPTDAQRPVLDTTQLEAALGEEMGAMRAPGVAIAVVNGDRVVYAKGFGVASVETRQPITPQTLFRIGSATKILTGLTAVLLAREGMVDLNQPIGRYARGLEQSLGAVTLHELLTHTGGLTNEGAASGPHDDAALGGRVRAWGAEHAFAPPGDVYSYTGPGFWLAGYAIEQAAKEWFADVVSKRALVPLGMHRSTFRPTMAMTYPLALDHRVDGERQIVLRPYPDDASTWASGSLFSNVEELARFAIAFMNGGVIDGKRALPIDAITTLSTKRSGVPGSRCGYTYGLSICQSGSVWTLGHYGFRVGSGAVVTMAPAHRVAVIILSNRNGGIFARTERHVLEQLIPGLRGAPDDDPARSTAQSPGVRPADFLGSYVNGPDTLRFVEQRDTLWYRYKDEAMVARADGNAVAILGRSGQAVQQFQLVRGAKTGDVYLHDGLNAFRRLSVVRGPSRTRP
jgi:CubicO group peptidase (beta-lactamase class C family)